MANELTSNPSDSLIANKTAIAGLLPVIAYAAADRTEMTAKHEQLINEDARAMVEPMWRTDVHTSDEELRTWDVLKKARYFLISSFLPGSDLRITAAQSQARSDGLLIGLALTAYKRENQRWPATLSELSPRFLPTVPVDPVTGEALHYRLTADGPLVYSVGVNRRDDGGRPTPIPGNALRWDSAKLEAAREGTEFDGDWRMWPLMKDTEGK